MSSSNLTGIYGGSDDPCILGYTNGTYPNGTLGKGNWRRYGVYSHQLLKKAACQAPNDPWVWTQYYGWWTTYFIMVGVVAVSLVNGIKRLHNLNRIMGLPSIIYHHPKVSALFRMGSYPALKFLRVELPPLGPAIFLFGFLTYSTLVCFLRRPFYRPPHYGGSPLGIRAEWVATAMVPWLYATATKRNFLVYFTGELLVNPEPVHMARFYESFFIFHMVAAFIFLVWMYIHLENVLDSWQYMHAATVLWAAGILWRLVAYTLDHGWFSRVPRATIEALPANAVRLRIPHQAMGSHILSHFHSPNSISQWNRRKRNGLRTASSPRLTARLKTLADMPTLPAIRACLIDGPYGGFMDSLRACDTVLLPTTIRTRKRDVVCTALEIHWAIRDSVCLEWFRKQLSEIESVKIYVTNETQPLQSDQNTAEIKEQEKEQVEIEEQEQGNVGIEEQEKKTSLTPTLRSRTHYNRPNLPEVIGAAAGRYAGRIGVMVCGPTSMVTEVRSTVAQLQKSILLSKKNVKCNELELYQESFDD
ncbi:hypothetical protein KEM48_008252 [Puccinia striiformis f. sp. tritici PST-130]|nr:hypothetical protein KEM48_008252 [Puccinia striiformis f. sp. tritici PST-130]